MKQYFARCLALTACALLPSIAFAGTGSGNVTQVGAIQSGVVIFITTTHSGAPVCGSNYGWAINTGTASGKAIYALLLTAVNEGKTVTVQGANTCDAWADRETAAQLLINF